MAYSSFLTLVMLTMALGIQHSQALQERDSITSQKTYDFVIIGGA